MTVEKYVVNIYELNKKCFIPMLNFIPRRTRSRYNIYAFKVNKKKLYRNKGDLPYLLLFFHLSEL